MDTYYFSESKLIELLKAAYVKGYHGFLDLADSTVEGILAGLAENKHSPKEVMVNDDFVVNDSILSVSGSSIGTTTITGSSLGGWIDAAHPFVTSDTGNNPLDDPLFDGNVTDVLPEGEIRIQETENDDHFLIGDS